MTLTPHELGIVIRDYERRIDELELSAAQRPIRVQKWILDNVGVLQKRVSQIRRAMTRGKPEKETLEKCTRCGLYCQPKPEKEAK